MSMTPERVAQRVDALIESIREGTSYALAEHSAALTIDYIEQVHHIGIINAAQFQALVIAVNEVADDWNPKAAALPAPDWPG